MSVLGPAILTGNQTERDRVDPLGILPGPAPSQYKAPSEDETKLVSQLNEKFYQAERQRKPYDANWEFNRLMLLGEQRVLRRPYDPEVLRVLSQDDSGRRYSQDNVLRVTSRAFVGKAIRIIPGVDVQPASTDRDDILGAEIRKSYLDWWSEQNDMRRLYKRVWEDIPWCGTGVLELYWDREAGTDMFWCQTCDFVSIEGQEGEPCPLCQLMQMQQAQMAAAQGMPIQPQQVPNLVPVKSGLARVRRLEPGEFYPEPGITELCDLQWYFTRRALPVAAIRKLCPERGMIVEEEANLYKDRWVSYTGSLLTARVHTEFVSGYANLYTYQERPSAQYPEGRIIYMANDRVLKAGPNPYFKRFKRLPVYAMRGERIPGVFWGEALLDQQVHLQKEYNHLLTQMREHRELTLNPKFYAQAGSGVKMSRTDTTAGEVIYVRRGYKYPETSRLPALPSHVFNESMRLVQTIRQKAFLTDYDVGASTMDQSGRSMALLASQSGELMGPLMVENIPEWLMLHKHALILAEELDPPERRWLVNGSDRLLQYSWSQVSSRQGWDVILSDEDSLSKNPTLRRQEALEMLAQGVYTDVNSGIPDMRRFMHDAGLKQPGAGIDSTTSEHTHAALIPERIARGEVVVPQLFDDANVHALELLNWLRGKGRTAPPPIQQAVMQLWIKYAMAAMPTPDAAEFMPNPGMMQATMAGPGQGNPVPGPMGGGGGGGMGAGQLPQGQPGPQQMIQQADEAGEVAAIGNRPHEG